MRIFKAMGQPYCDGDTDAEKWPIDDAENVCNNIALAGFRIPEWQDYKKAFQEKGPWDSKIEKPEAWGTYRRYETGWATTSDSPAGGAAVMVHLRAWDTSTGKQEIWSTVIDNYYPTMTRPFRRSARLRTARLPIRTCSRTTTRSWPPPVDASPCTSTTSIASFPGAASCGPCRASR